MPETEIDATDFLNKFNLECMGCLIKEKSTLFRDSYDSLLDILKGFLDKTIAEFDNSTSMSEGDIKKLLIKLLNDCRCAINLYNKSSDKKKAFYKGTREKRKKACDKALNAIESMNNQVSNSETKFVKGISYDVRGKVVYEYTIKDLGMSGLASLANNPNVKLRVVMNGFVENNQVRFEDDCQTFLLADSYISFKPEASSSGFVGGILRLVNGLIRKFGKVEKGMRIRVFATPLGGGLLGGALNNYVEIFDGLRDCELRSLQTIQNNANNSAQHTPPLPPPRPSTSRASTRPAVPNHAPPPPPRGNAGNTSSNPSAISKKLDLSTSEGVKEYFEKSFKDWLETIKDANDFYDAKKGDLEKYKAAWTYNKGEASENSPNRKLWGNIFAKNWYYTKDFDDLYNRDYSNKNDPNKGKQEEEFKKRKEKAGASAQPLFERMWKIWDQFSTMKNLIITKEQSNVISPSDASAFKTKVKNKTNDAKATYNKILADIKRCMGDGFTTASEYEWKI